MERLTKKISSAQRALNTLKELVGLENVSIISRDAAIQRFEYTFEAVWKVSKLYLMELEGLDIASPKGVIRACMLVGIFNREETSIALDMVDDRNMTSHTYNEGLSERLYKRLEGYARICDIWLTKIEERIRQSSD